MSVNEPAFEGSCLCGAVQYRFTGSPTKMTHCHCTDCRKHGGTAFATFMEIPRARFAYVKGESELTTHTAETGTKRRFCRRCGSSIEGFTLQDSEFTYITAATLDTRLDSKPDYHIFVRSKVPWLDIRDGLPQHSAYPENQS